MLICSENLKGGIDGGSPLRGSWRMFCVEGKVGNALKNRKIQASFYVCFHVRLEERQLSFCGLNRTIQLNRPQAFFQAEPVAISRHIRPFATHSAAPHRSAIVHENGATARAHPPLRMHHPSRPHARRDAGRAAHARPLWICISTRKCVMSSALKLGPMIRRNAHAILHHATLYNRTAT